MVLNKNGEACLRADPSVAGRVPAILRAKARFGKVFLMVCRAHSGHAGKRACASGKA